MNKIITYILLVILFLSCNSDSQSEYLVEDFRWKINKPKYTKIETPEKSSRDIQEGKEILAEKNVNLNVDKKSKNYLTIRKSQLGKIQINKIYHEMVLTDRWNEYLDANRDQIYNGYLQLGFTIDSSSSKIEIDSFEFDVLSYKLKDRASGVSMTHHLYKKYYPEKKSEFVISVTYGSIREKELLLGAINNSEFY